MSFPEEIDIDWINGWLDHGDKKRIAKETGRDQSTVSKVLKKKAKDFDILKKAKEIAQANHRSFNQ
jgi:acid phosphatase class B